MKNDVIQIIITSAFVYYVNILYMQQYKSRHLCVKLKTFLSSTLLFNKNKVSITVWILILQLFLIILTIVLLVGYFMGVINVQNIKLFKFLLFYFVLTCWGVMVIDAILFAK